METSALRLTRYTTHVLLALTVVAIFHAGLRLRSALGEQANIGATQLSVAQKLDDLTRSNPLRPISSALGEANASEAQKRIHALQKTIARLEATLHIHSEKLLTETLEKFQGAVQESAGLSHPPELLNTLSEKATSLRQLAQSRNWRNLTAYASRLEARLRGLRLSGRMESPQVRYAESDIASMERLTRTSTLDASNKQEVLRRLEGLRQEITMLSEVHVAGKQFQNLEAQGREGMARWLGRARLAAAALKTAGERRLQGAVQELWIVGALVLLVWGALTFLWSTALRAQRYAQDQSILEVLRDGVMHGNSNWRQHIGEARLDEVERTLRLAHKRMSLGDDVQHALPFAALLINQQGRIVWANQALSDEFHLDHESLMEEDFTWEQLRRRLTGVPSQAIDNALLAAEGGTWQIQAEVEQGVCLPYEMHVSPIAGKTETKVLVLFYSMVLMREAITDQARLVADPMRAAIQALETGSWSTETEKRLAPLWSAAGLGADWGRLAQALHRLDGSRHELLSQVALQENTVHDQSKFIQELEMGIDRRRSTLKEQIRALKELRDGLVSLDEQGQELGQGHVAVVQEARSFAKRTEILRESIKAVIERLQSTKDSVGLLERHKQDYKFDKSEVQESKMELMKLHNRFLGSLPELSHGSETLAAAMKDQLLRLDEGLSRLDARLSQIDVQITKLAMSCAGQVPETDRLTLDLSSFEETRAAIQQTMREDQEHVVTLLRTLVDGMREDHDALAQLREGAPVVTPTNSPDSLYPFV